MTSKEAKLENLTFGKFRRLALDPELSRYEKIGFLDELRAGREGEILADMLAKLSNLRRPAQRVLDIGCGCSELPDLLIGHARELGHSLFLLDSPEMLAHLPDSPGVVKLPGMFPDQVASWLEEQTGRLDAILVYSVFHYLVDEVAVPQVFDRTLALLAPGGQLLVGDLPNVSKRNRLFASEAGRAFHRSRHGEESAPETSFNAPLAGGIDDALVFFLMLRARAQGYESYLLPQPPSLPMANRREDLLIVRP